MDTTRYIQKKHKLCKLITHLFIGFIFQHTLYEVNKWCVLYCSQPLLWQQHRGPSSSSYFSVQNSIGKAQRETHHLHKTYLATATKPALSYQTSAVSSRTTKLATYSKDMQAKLRHCCHTRHSVLFLSIKSDKEFLVCVCNPDSIPDTYNECTQFLLSILKLALSLPRRFVNSMIFLQKFQ